jgi:hypothetical protein
MRWLAIVMLFLLAACGNDRPSVSSVRLSQRSVSRGREFFATLVGVADPDGNVYAGKVKIRMKTKGTDQIDLEEEVLPFERHLDRPEGDLIIGLTLFGAIPVGDFSLEAQFEDEGGADADPVTVDLSVIN